MDGDEFYLGKEIENDEQNLDCIKKKKSLQTVWHASCTCKMGKESDEMAVLDERCRVRGVQGLRVVDVSSFPFLPPSHPQSTDCELSHAARGLCSRNLTDMKRRRTCRESYGFHQGWGMRLETRLWISIVLFLMLFTAIFGDTSI